MTFRKSSGVNFTTIGVGNYVAAMKSVYLMVYFWYEHKSFVTTV